MNPVIRRGSVSPGWVVYDRWPGATRILGYFGTHALAEEYLPKLISMEERLERERLAREAAEAEAAAGKPTLIKRKA